jgi:transposase
MTDGLLALRDWLCAQQVRVVGMESTGAYWKPVYYLLEDDLQCWLLNAHQRRNVPGRKTDLSDAAWSCQLVAHGLVRPSFVPPRPIRQLRDRTRSRKVVIPERTREAQRLEKVREDAGIKLSSVASDILGVSGRAMLAALLGAAATPPPWPSWPRVAGASSSPSSGPRCGATSTVITVCWPPRCSPRIDAADETIQRLSGEIDRVIAPSAWALTLLETIPGVARRTAEVIVAETGADMGRFPSAAHLACWAGRCPGTGESAGKHHSGKTRKGSKWLRGLLVEAAYAAVRTSDTYLAAQDWRLGRRRNDQRAAVAVGHSILVSASHVRDRRQLYAELGGDYFLERQSNKAHVRRLIHQLERLGHKVSIHPAEPAA